VNDDNEVEKNLHFSRFPNLSALAD
jgi:hypothetical protein